MNNKFFAILGLFAVSLMLAACGAAATPETITVVETVVVEKEVEGQMVTVVETVEVEKVVEKIVEVTAVPQEEAMDPNAPVLIVWWSHFADQPNKRLVIEKVIADYEAEHPNVDIVMTWWDKNPLRDAIRSTMTAGEGAPDITTFDTEVTEWVDADWLLDLTDALPWENFVEGTDLDGYYPNLGYEGHYKFNIGASVDMIFYNPDIFEELGIEVPEDFQFTEQEFLDVVQKCGDAGYAGYANAIGNRPTTGIVAVQNPMWNLVGAEESNLYFSGQKSWDTPEARHVLEYTAQLRDAGLWSESFSTMTIDEYHAYFHTQRQACMFPIPSWYTGRAFKPVEQGGQDPNWHFGMLRYPRMDGCQACDAIHAGFESGYGVLSSTKHPEVAKDILAYFSQPKYGALWTAITDIPSPIQYDTEKDWPSEELVAKMAEQLGTTPGQWDWYWEEYNKVYGGLPTMQTPTSACGDFNDAMTNALSQGIPLDLVSVDEAVEMLDSALCTP